MDSGHQRLKEAKTLFDETQLSVLWGISPKTLHNKRVTGDGLPFTKISRLLDYQPQEITALEKDILRRSTSETGKATIVS